MALRPYSFGTLTSVDMTGVSDVSRALIPFNSEIVNSPAGERDPRVLLIVQIIASYEQLLSDVTPQTSALWQKAYDSDDKEFSVIQFSGTIFRDFMKCLIRLIEAQMKGLNLVSVGKSTRNDFEFYRDQLKNVQNFCTNTLSVGGLEQDGLPCVSTLEKSFHPTWNIIATQVHDSCQCFIAFLRLFRRGTRGKSDLRQNAADSIDSFMKISTAIENLAQFSSHSNSIVRRKPFVADKVQELRATFDFRLLIESFRSRTSPVVAISLVKQFQPRFVDVFAYVVEKYFPIDSVEKYVCRFAGDSVKYIETALVECLIRLSKLVGSHQVTANELSLSLGKISVLQTLHTQAVALAMRVQAFTRDEYVIHNENVALAEQARKHIEAICEPNPIAPQAIRSDDIFVLSCCALGAVQAFLMQKTGQSSLALLVNAFAIEDSAQQAVITKLMAFSDFNVTPIDVTSSESHGETLEEISRMTPNQLDVQGSDTVITKASSMLFLTKPVEAQADSGSSSKKRHIDAVDPNAGAGGERKDDADDMSDDNN